MFFILFIIILAILIYFFRIQIEIENLKFSTEKIGGKFLNKNYDVLISIYLGEKIKIFKGSIRNIISKNDKLKNIDISSFNKKNMKIKEITEIIKKLNVKVKKFDLKIDVGTENAFFTSLAFAIISSIITVLAQKIISNSEEKDYNINPVYINKNLLNVEFDCIFSTKLIHIIYIIYILKKKGRDEKYGRTSNRRSYGYSYE